MRNLLLLQHAVEKRVKRFLSIFRRPCIQHTDACLEGVEGQFPVFVVDDGEPKKFIVPLRYLDYPPFLRLLEAAAEEFGFDQPGVLFIPCRAREIQAILF
ncbi:hypothetical protein AAC387_Pa11g0025 [Persea americana]